MPTWVTSVGPILRGGTLVFPPLVLVYYPGRATAHRPDAILNPFYRMAPDWALLSPGRTGHGGDGHRLPGADLRRVSLTGGRADGLQPAGQHQAQVTRTRSGQIYMGAINWLLMVACIGLVIGFQESANPGGALGFGVDHDGPDQHRLLLHRGPGTVSLEPLANSALPAVPGPGIDLAFFGATLFRSPERVGGSRWWRPLSFRS